MCPECKEPKPLYKTMTCCRTCARIELECIVELMKEKEPDTVALFIAINPDLSENVPDSTIEELRKRT